MEALRISKKRVRVRAELVNQTSQIGEFYADLYRLDGSLATIVDRLNDPVESYLPLARGNQQHVLLSKANLLTVSMGASEIELPRAEGITALRAEFLLSAGAALRGKVYAFLPPAHTRLLDYLNRNTERFITLFVDDGVTLINRDHVIGVTELL